MSLLVIGTGFPIYLAMSKVNVALKDADIGHEISIKRYINARYIVINTAIYIYAHTHTIYNICTQPCCFYFIFMLSFLFVHIPSCRFIGPRTIV